MMALGIGGVLLCYSFYRSKAISHWLSIWGMPGYCLLFRSAILDQLGVLDAADGFGPALYAPLGLWALIALAPWLYIDRSDLIDRHGFVLTRDVG